MRFLSARQVISYAYKGNYSSVASYTGLGLLNSPPRRCCPDCHRTGIVKKGKTVLDCASAKRRDKEVVWWCGACDKGFRRPVFAMAPAAPDVGDSVGYVSNCWAICDGLQRGDVRRVVEALPEAHYNWLMYVYTDHLSGIGIDQCEAQLLDWIGLEVDRNPPCKLSTYHSFRAVVRMVLMQLQAARELERNGRQLYSDADIALRIFGDVEKRSNLRKDRPWGRLKGFVEDLIDRLGREALAPVRDLVEAERAREEAA